MCINVCSLHVFASVNCLFIYTPDSDIPRPSTVILRTETLNAFGGLFPYGSKDHLSTPLTICKVFFEFLGSLFFVIQELFSCRSFSCNFLYDAMFMYI